MSRNQILANVKNSLEKNKNIPSQYVSYENPMRHMQENIIEEFKNNQISNKAIVIETNNILEAIKNILKEIGAQKLLLNAALEKFNISPLTLTDNTCITYNESIDNIREELFHIDTSIVEARCGIANVGIIGLSSNPNEPRLSSLITNNCIYILNKNSIVESLNDGINLIKEYEKNRTNNDVLPTNIIFVAGPSRTADIELKTVFGVHGPRVVYVVLY